MVRIQLESGQLCYWLTQTILSNNDPMRKKLGFFFFWYSIERHRDLNEQKNEKTLTL